MTKLIGKITKRFTGHIEFQRNDSAAKEKAKKCKLVPVDSGRMSSDYSQVGGPTICEAVRKNQMKRSLITR